MFGGALQIGIAMFQPDQPGNLGAAMRLCACLDTPLHIIEPCGFPLDDRRIRRSGMDYLHQLAPRRHVSYEHFDQWRRAQKQRLVLLTTKADQIYHQLSFRRGDLLLVGSESAGVPLAVHASVDQRVRIAMANEARSLNVVLAAGIVISEALRQLGDTEQMSSHPEI